MDDLQSYSAVLNDLREKANQDQSNKGKGSGSAAGTVSLASQTLGGERSGGYDNMEELVRDVSRRTKSRNREESAEAKQVMKALWEKTNKITDENVIVEIPPKGKTLKEAEKISNKDIVRELEGLPPLKHHCSLLGADALHLAIKNYKEKKK